MSANTTPRFTDGGRVWPGQVTTANANLDGTGAVVTVVTAGANGSLIELIRLKATVTTTGGMVRVFIHDGTNFRLYHEIPVTAATPSATVAAYAAEYLPTTPLVLPTGYTLRFSTANSEAINVVCSGGDY